MRRDPTEFRKRFQKWKSGAKPYQYGIPYEDDNHNPDYDQARANQLGYTPDETGHYPSRDYETGRYLKSVAHPTVSKSIYTDMGLGYDVFYNQKDGQLYSQPNWGSSYQDRLPKYNDGKSEYKYVQAGADDSWSRITNDDMSQAFQNLVVRPKNRGGNTTVGNWKRSWSVRPEPGLKIVSPEFDIVAGIRAFIPGINTTTRNTYKVARQFKPIKSEQKYLKLADDYAKDWFNQQTTFRTPFKSSGRGGNTVGDVLDYNLGLFGGRQKLLSHLTDNQRYRIATMLSKEPRFPKTSKIIHMEDSGIQPVNKTGFVPKDATNSNSVWNNSLVGEPEIWWNRGTPYYDAKGYRSVIDIPRTIVSDVETLKNNGITLTGTDVLHGPGVVPFESVEYGLQPNMFGWFDKIKFVGQ